MKKTTEELLEELKNKRKIEDYFKENSTELSFESLSQMLCYYIEKNDLTKSEVLERSMIEKHYGYQILSGVKKNPTRDKLLMMCIGLKLDVDETQHVLRKAGLGDLYPREQRDAVIAFALAHGNNVMETNEMLHDMKLKLLE